uniref:HAT C-terminal dimerisation domain-containing protein n=1 Tax=Octopus bimaculoides TaxID=37653 RepID=A0A0L8GAF4_OCTBM
MVVEASCEIVILIAKSKKSHNIGESPIKPSLLHAAELILGKGSANKLSQISLSNDTVKGRIDNLSQDTKDQILDQEILLFSPSIVQQQQLFFMMYQTSFRKTIFCGIHWQGLCTDGAPAMLGLQSGFITSVKEKKNPSVVGTHCILHHEALASRTLPTEMRNVLNMAIKVADFVKGGALNSRLFKLLCKDMESEHKALFFHTNLSLAYLVDIFEVLNALDLKLLGKNTNILMHHDLIRTFMAKLDLWKCQIQEGNTASSSCLDFAFIHGNLDSELKKQIITHLTDLKTEFIRYFPDIDESNPFQCEVTDVLDEVQEEFLELKFNSPAKEDFKELDLETFWIKYLPLYPLILHQAHWILAMFGSTYLCEAAFSTLIADKTKYRNRLNVERDLHCALFGIQPCIQDFVAKKRCQVSH